MHKLFGLNYYLFCILALFTVLYFTKNMRDEGFFGMSSGTMDQLSSTHVPTSNDAVQEAIQINLIEKGIKQMTESGFGDKKEMFGDKKDEEKVLEDLYRDINA